MHHDPNTYVSYLEFLAAVLLKRVVIDDDRLELAFCSMDVESTGLLHRGTFRYLIYPHAFLSIYF